MNVRETPSGSRSTTVQPSASQEPSYSSQSAQSSGGAGSNGESVVRTPSFSDRLRLRLHNWIQSLLPRVQPQTSRELTSVLESAATSGLFEKESINTILGAIAVADLHVRDIMIPRSALAVLDEDIELPELLATIVQARHSRYPVVGDDLEDIKGILHAKDVLGQIGQDESRKFSIRDVIRPATVVPESKRLNGLLSEFRTNRNHMAIVVDEYGQVSGAVTIEDVLEQIVGDIEDEHDVEEAEGIVKLGGGQFSVKAGTPIEDFNAYFSVGFPTEEFHSIGGLVLKAFGKIPERGEECHVGGYRFEVLNVDSRRLRLLRVRNDTNNAQISSPPSDAED